MNRLERRNITYWSLTKTASILSGLIFGPILQPRVTRNKFFSLFWVVVLIYRRHKSREELESWLQRIGRYHTIMGITNSTIRYAWNIQPLFAYCSAQAVFSLILDFSCSKLRKSQEKS